MPRRAFFFNKNGRCIRTSLFSYKLNLENNETEVLAVDEKDMESIKTVLNVYSGNNVIKKVVNIGEEPKYFFKKDIPLEKRLKAEEGTLVPEILQEGSKPVTVVTGLARSGTSMMMQMLEAGGLPVLANDRFRPPNKANPKGFYEYERVGSLPWGDCSWMSLASGRAIKLLYPLIFTIPKIYNYQIVFMKRNPEEILESRRNFLDQTLKKELSEAEKERNNKFVSEYDSLVSQFEAWAQEMPNTEYAVISYNDLLLTNSNKPIQQVADLVSDKSLDIKLMKEVVDPSLYRNKKKS